MCCIDRCNTFHLTRNTIFAGTHEARLDFLVLYEKLLNLAVNVDRVNLGKSSLALFSH